MRWRAQPAIQNVEPVEVNLSDGPSSKRSHTWILNLKWSLESYRICIWEGGVFRCKRVTCGNFILLLSRQWTDRALMMAVFCLWPVDQSVVVLVYCHLGKLKAGRGPLHPRLIRMSHNEQKPFCLYDSNHCLYPLLHPFCFRILQRPYISNGSNSGMAPTNTSASTSASAFPSSLSS